MNIDTMNSHSQYALILVGALVLAVIAVIAWSYAQKRRQRQSANLRQRFGPEYDRVVNELQDRGKAESELQARTQRVARLNIVPLSVSEAARFKQAWDAVQARFVDEPAETLVRADALVYELMTKRGYPMGDFEARAADISVDHPRVVSNYRAARAIALADKRGDADTELLRRAVVHYRALFEDLLEVREADPGMVPQGIAR
jgi:hypothetical protein